MPDGQLTPDFACEVIILLPTTTPLDAACDVTTLGAGAPGGLLEYTGS